MKGVSMDRALAVTALIAVLVRPVPARAQRGQDAALVGTVRDASGAVLAGAIVSVSSAQLIGGPQQTTCDAAGAYTFPILSPGRYDVVAQRAGFRTERRLDVSLLPGLLSTVDFKLDVASLDTVVVQGMPPTVDVRSSAAPVLIERKLLENLPLSRVASEAVNLAPGVVRDVAFGGTQNSNPLSIDGASGNEPSFGTPTVTPNLNWMEELQVVSIGADAQYGEFTGARENAITRSGSNVFSGMAHVWTTRPGWSGNNRGALGPQLRDRFRPADIFQRWDLDGQVGGPVLRNRLWFFGGAEMYRDVSRPAGFTGLALLPGETRLDAREPKFIAKVDAALTTAARADGYYIHDTQRTSGANAAPNVRPEAIVNVDRAESIWNGKLQWTVGPRTFLEVRQGGHHSDRFSGPPEERRSGPPGHFDELTTIISENALTFSHVTSQPIGTSAQLTHLVSDRNGHGHELRAGYEYEHARLLQAEGYIGGMIFLDFDGQAQTVQIGGDRIYRPTFNRQTLYVQDAWSAADRVTVNAGLRTGFYNGAVPDRGRVFDARSLSPRIGAAWDVAADHRTVVRAHVGRYHDEMATTFFDFLDPLSQNPIIVADVIGPGQYREVARLGSTINASIDPDLKFSFVDEYLVGFERQLPWAISTQANYIHRDFKNTIGFIDADSIWDPVLRLDPGPDGRAGTADDAGTITVFAKRDFPLARLVQTNPAGAYRHYRGLELIATRRFRRDLGLQASYTWSRTLANYNNGFSSNAGSADLGINGVFVNPNKKINIDGRPTGHDYPHNLKALWTYRLPAWGGMNVSGVYRVHSGRAWARNIAGLGAQINTAVVVEPRGTRRMPAVHTIDLRLEKTFRAARRGGRFGVFADVFNAGNQGVPLTVNNGSGPNLGVPNSWLEPRSLRAGARVIF